MKQRTAGIFLLAAMMLTSSMMVFILSGASGTGEPWTPDGFYELMDRHRTGAFVENGGQWDDDIRFAARTSFGHIAFADDRILFDLMPNAAGIDDTLPSAGSMVIMDFHGTGGVMPQGRDPLPTRTNIFHGTDPEGWGTNLRSYGKIVYEDLWEGIDLVYDSDHDRIKYDYRVAPWADHGEISFNFRGLEDIEVMERGLGMTAENGMRILDDGLFCYHDRTPDTGLHSGFIIRDDGTIGYRVEGRVRSETLVIDPVIYSTYIGGSNSEYETDMAIDGSGACYLAGSTWSFDFPTTAGAYSTRVAGENDGFVMKIRPDGSSPVYSTFIGGSGYDSICSIALDQNGNAYIAGQTESTDYPVTKGAFNETLNGTGQDLVVSKLDPSGSRMVYSTYIGGDSWENMNQKGCIAVDSRGCAYIIGSSNSREFPVTADAFDKENNNTQGGGDWEWVTSKVVLVKLKADGTGLEYSTYLGGEMDEYAYGLTLDDEGMVWVLGTTGSADFPVTKGAFDTSLDSWSSELFVARIDISGSLIVHATLLGGSFDQTATDIEIDSSGRPYICGWTGSTDFPVMDNTYQHELNGWNDIFVTAFDPTLSTLYMSTFIGGSEGEQAYSLDLDNEGNVMITGSTASADYPTIVTHTIPKESDDGSILISVLDPLGKELIYSTLVGGVAAPRFPEDVGFNIFNTGERRVVISGYSDCSDFPVTDDAYDDTSNGEGDLVLFEFDLSLPPSAPGNVSLFQGDGFLNLTWEPPVEDGGMPLLGYIVYRGQREDDLTVLNRTGKELFLNDTDVDMGKVYYYTVRACNLVGTGLPGDIVSSKAACSPTPPQFFRLARGNGCIKLAWEAPVFDGSYSLDGYRIYRSSDGSDLEVREIEAFKLEYSDKEVVNGVNYTYYMTTWNFIGESLPTPCLWTIPQGWPSAPENVAVLNGSDSVTITWEEPEDDGGSRVLFYRIHIGLEAGGTVHWRYDESLLTEYADHLVEIGKVYRYYVTAVNSEGESQPSAEVMGRPQMEPTSPENVQVSEGDGYLIITWDAPSYLGGLELEGYRLYRSEAGEGFQMIREPSFDEGLFKDKDVVNGRTYSYKVSAWNSFGESEPSDPVTATPAGIPGEPTGVTITAGSGSIELSWTAPASNGGAPIIEYQVRRKADDGTFAIISRVGPSTVSFTDGDVEPGVEYTYRVKAVNRIGPSNGDDEVAIIARGIPASPTDIEVKYGDGHVEVSWTAPANTGGCDLTGYRIMRTQSGMEGSPMIVGADVTSFLDESIVYGQAYIYGVTALNQHGGSPQANSTSIIPYGAPSAPEDLVHETDGMDVRLSWYASGTDGGCCIELYRIYRLKDGGSEEHIGTVEGDRFSYTDHPVESGDYTYRVLAVNSIGKCSDCAEVQVKVSGESSGSFIEEQIGLLVTVPLIVILIIVLLLVMARKKGREDELNTTPQPSLVDADGSLNGGYTPEAYDALGGMLSMNEEYPPEQ